MTLRQRAAVAGRWGFVLTAISPAVMFALQYMDVVPPPQNGGGPASVERVAWLEGRIEGLNDKITRLEDDIRELRRIKVR